MWDVTRRRVTRPVRTSITKERLSTFETRKRKTSHVVMWYKVKIKSYEEELTKKKAGPEIAT